MCVCLCKCITLYVGVECFAVLFVFIDDDDDVVKHGVVVVVTVYFAIYQILHRIRSHTHK